MRINLIILLLTIFNTLVFGQSGYVVLNAGDTVNCEINKAWPSMIKIEGAKYKKEFKPGEIRGYYYDSTYFASKKIQNTEDSSGIFLPVSKKDIYQLSYSGVALMSGPSISKLSGKGFSIYKLTTRSLGTNGAVQVSHTLFFENDTIGLSIIPTMGSFSGKKKKTKILALLKNYFKGDAKMELILTEENIAISFDINGIIEIAEEYLGKKFSDLKKLNK